MKGMKSSRKITLPRDITVAARVLRITVDQNTPTVA